MTESIVRKIIFPFGNFLMNRKHVNRNYKLLLENRMSDPEMTAFFQWRNLQAQLKYAEQHVPYYRKKFKEIGMTAEDIKSLSDFRNVPILSREDVEQNTLDLLDERFLHYSGIYQRTSKVLPPFITPYYLKKNTSSGSTGEPIEFYENGSVSAMNWSYELYLKKIFNQNPGVREARLHRFSVDYFKKLNPVMIRKFLWNQYVLPGINLAKEDYKFIFEKLKSFKPKIIWGFTSAVTGLAEYIREYEEGKTGFHPNLIITWAAPLYAHEESVIKSVFGINITNLYGMREVGHIGSLCPEHMMHINEDFQYLENDKETDNETASELLVTTLYDTPMPFIRYRTGDIGRIEESSCACGNKHRVIGAFSGRTGEVFITKKGKMISPNFWCRIFMVENTIKKIRKFQIIYRKDGGIRILLVKTEAYSESFEKSFMEELYRNFGDDMEIELKFVEQLKNSESGKYKMVSWE